MRMSGYLPTGFERLVGPGQRKPRPEILAEEERLSIRTYRKLESIPPGRPNFIKMRCNARRLLVCSHGSNPINPRLLLLTQMFASRRRTRIPE